MMCENFIILYNYLWTRGGAGKLLRVVFREPSREFKKGK